MARGWTWRKCAQLASVLGSIKIAHRGGQNHRPTRETIAADFRSAFGETL
jgi:adenosine kinase